MVRIRYKEKYDPVLGILVSDNILAGNDTYQAIIVYDNIVMLNIVNSKNKSVKEIECKNVVEAKRKAKLELKKLGAQFYDEVRRR